MENIGHEAIVKERLEVITNDIHEFFESFFAGYVRSVKLSKRMNTLSNIEALNLFSCCRDFTASALNSST